MRPPAVSTAALMIVGLVAIAPVQAAPAEEIAAADLLPDTTILYAEISDPARLLDDVLAHPLRKKVESLDEYQKAVATPQFFIFKAVVAAVEKQIDMTWQQALAKSTGGGLYAAVDADTGGVVFLAKTTDPKRVQKTIDTLLKFARSEAERKGEPDPVPTSQYRGVTVYKTKEAGFALHQGWLVASNKQELGQSVLDALLGDKGSPLSGDEQFSAALKARRASTAWVYADLNAMRAAKLAVNVLSGRPQNPLVEVFAGGLLDAASEGSHAAVAIDFDKEKLGLSVAVPYDAAEAEERQHFFGPDGRGQAAPLIVPENVLLAASGYRDISSMWSAAPDLFDEKTNAQIDRANSGLSTLFATKDFYRDILGAFGSDAQLILTRQSFKGDAPTPAIKLPAGAVVLRMKDREKLERRFRVSYQSLVGFGNVIGTLQGSLPPLELGQQTHGEVRIDTATYLVPQETKKTGAPIHYNFSPSIAFVGDYFVAGSTKDVVREVATAIAAPRSKKKDARQIVVNSQVVVDFGTLKKVLADNREQLVTQNMLEKGHDRKAAEKEIGLLLELVDSVDRLTLRLATDHGNKLLRLDAQTGFAVE